MNKNETMLDKINKVLTIAGTTILMNLIFLVSCLPIVTMGQAWCALLTGIRYSIRGDSWWHGFKHGFKTRFWRGTIAWCLMLIPNIYFLLEVHYGYAQGYVVQLISACLMLALTTMVTTALLTLNVYIPTAIGNWIRNAVNLVFKVPLMLLAAAGVFWLPVLLGLLRPDWLFYTLLIFIAAYFPLAGLINTVTLKEALLDYLIEARANGTLLAEEGKLAEQVEDEEDEEEEVEEEEDEEDSGEV